MTWLEAFLTFCAVLFCLGSTTTLIGYMVTGGPRKMPGFWGFVAKQLAVVAWVTALVLLGVKILD